MDGRLVRFEGVRADTEPWAFTWDQMAFEQACQAQGDQTQRFERTAGLRLLRAVMYRVSGKRHLPPVR